MTIDNFERFSIVNTDHHAAIASNRSAGTTITGNADSVFEITVVNNEADKSRAAIEDCTAADAAGTSIKAGTIRVTTPNQYVVSNAYRTALDGNPTPGKIVLEGNNEVVLKTTYEGGYAIANLNNMTDSSVRINKTARGRVDITGNIDASHGLADIDFAGANSRLAGSVTTAGETGKAVLNFIGDNSTMNGNITAADGSTVTETLSGANTTMTGDITAGGTSTVTAELSGENSTLTGNITINDNSTASFKATGRKSLLRGKIAVNGSAADAQFTGDGSSWTGDLEVASGTADLNLSGAAWNGNLNASGGTTTLALADGSTWTGAADTASGAQTSVTIASGAAWNVVSDSSLTNLTLSSGGQLSMEGTANRLHIENLTAPEAVSGTLHMDLVYHDNSLSTYENAADSDYLYIGSGSGATFLVEPTSSSTLNDMSDGDRLYFAQTGVGSSAFLVNQEVLLVNSNKLYDKSLLVETAQDSAQSNYENWYLTPNRAAEVDGDTLNPNGLVPGSAFTAALAIWRDGDTLLKRLGELRYNQGGQGTWARYSRRKLEKEYTHAFSSKLNALQVGYDAKRTGEKGDWYYGAAIEHVWGDTDYDCGSGYGSGDSKMTDLTLYGSSLRRSGHYLDLTARVGRVDTDYDVTYSKGGDSGDFDNWAFSVGAEYGRKSGLGSGWYWEWQTQLTYSYVWGDDYTTANGAQISQDNFDSLVGRLGLVLSREFNTDSATPGRVYAKASLQHEFLGDSSERLYDDVIFSDSEDLDDTWYTVGLGADLKLSGNCSLYLDAERDFDAEIKNKYRFECGVRFEF